MARISLNKFEAAERQLLTAIRMFFAGEDAVSTHTLSEAASQILYDIRKDFGAQSILRDNSLVREDKKKVWRDLLVESRNFFKHADRDKDARHDFDDSYNHFSLLESALLYAQMKGRHAPETLVFTCWFSIQYPDVVVDGPYKNALGNFDGISAAKSEGLGFFTRVIEAVRAHPEQWPSLGA